MYIKEILEPESLESQIKAIINKCPTISDIYRKHDFLYRGLDESDFIVSKSIRQDRRPVDMDPQKHSLSIEAYKKLGIAAHRGNSIFCSPSLDIAEDWGEPYIVFPTDPFQFSYFANWYDFAQKYSPFVTIGEGILDSNRFHRYPYFLYDTLIDANTTVEELAALLQEAGLSNNSLGVAIDSEVEVLITGRTYYCILSHYEEEIRQLL